MNDRQRMEDLLMSAKGVCDLYLHGAMESADDRVHAAFHGALKNSLDMQHTIYGKMEAMGWYPPAVAEGKQLKQVKDKYPIE